MTNPYADTPLWARWYSEQMGWPVTAAVLNAADGPVRCDYCGASETWDLAWPTDSGWAKVWRPMTLENDYCFGCGAVLCQTCEERSRVRIGPHDQSGHLPVENVA